MKTLFKRIVRFAFQCIPRKSQSPGAFRSILVMEFTHAGDLILSFPFLRKLREIFPHARIDFACGSWGKEVLTLNPHIDGVISYDHPRFNRGRVHPLQSIRNTFKFIQDIRKSKYDASFELRGNFASALLNILSGSRYKYGRDISHYKFPYAYSVHDIDQPEAINKLNLLKPFIQTPWAEVSYDVRLPIGISENIERKFNNVFKKPYIVFHTLSPWIPRNWDLLRFQDLMTRLIRHFDIHIALIGSEKDRVENGGLHKIAPLRIFNLCGLLTWPETACLINKCLMFVGCDSGPGHLAASIGVNAVSLIGPGEYPRFAPYNPGGNIKIIRHPVCEYQKNNNCRPTKNPKLCMMIENICMKAIMVSDVFDAIKVSIESNPNYLLI